MKDTFSTQDSVSSPSNRAMDTATSRTIRIGKANIGLIGLDLALNRAAAENMDEDCAVDFLYDRIRNSNYIPGGMEQAYREALLREYRRHRQQETDEDDTLVIRIFGTGCISCNGLQALVIEVLDRHHIAADIEQIHDPDEIGRHGIVMTPALMINGQVKAGGLLPTPAQVEQWILEAHENKTRP